MRPRPHAGLSGAEGPGTSLLRDSRWDTVQNEPFLCWIWHIPAPQ